MSSTTAAWCETLTSTTKSAIGLLLNSFVSELAAKAQ
jgi:hypothetical protein